MSNDLSCHCGKPPQIACKCLSTLNYFCLVHFGPHMMNETDNHTPLALAHAVDISDLSVKHRNLKLDKIDIKLHEYENQVRDHITSIVSIHNSVKEMIDQIFESHHSKYAQILKDVQEIRNLVEKYKAKTTEESTLLIEKYNARKVQGILPSYQEIKPIKMIDILEELNKLGMNQVNSSSSNPTINTSIPKNMLPIQAPELNNLKIYDIEPEFRTHEKQVIDCSDIYKILGKPMPSNVELSVFHRVNPPYIPKLKHSDQIEYKHQSIPQQESRNYPRYEIFQYLPRNKHNSKADDIPSNHKPEGKNEWEHNATNQAVAQIYQPMYSEPKSQCCICSGYDTVSNLTSLSSCSHIIHRNCFVNYITGLIESNSLPVKCPLRDCIIKLDPSDIEVTLTDNLKQRFQQLYSKQMLIDAGLDYFECPECQNVCEKVKRNQIQCPYCKKYFCLKCNSESHPGQECRVKRFISRFCQSCGIDHGAMNCQEYFTFISSRS